MGGDRRNGGQAAFDALAGSLTPVRTPIGDAWILASDEPMFRSKPAPAAPARLLPSGDTFFLLWGRRPRTARPRSRPSRTSCGRRGSGRAPCSSSGEIVGTWRRADGRVTIQSWRRLSPGERESGRGGSGFPAPARRPRSDRRPMGGSELANRPLLALDLASPPDWPQLHYHGARLHLVLSFGIEGTQRASHRRSREASATDPIPRTVTGTGVSLHSSGRRLGPYERTGVTN